MKLNRIKIDTDQMDVCSRSTRIHTTITEVGVTIERANTREKEDASFLPHETNYRARSFRS